LRAYAMGGGRAHLHQRAHDRRRPADDHDDAVTGGRSEPRRKRTGCARSEPLRLSFEPEAALLPGAAIAPARRAEGRKIPRCGGLLPPYHLLSFRSDAREAVGSPPRLRMFLTDHHA